MTITVYAHWADQEIYTDQDRDEWIDDQAKDYYENSDELDEFLDNLTSTLRNPFVYLLDLSENAKQEIMKKFKEHCKELAIKDFNEEYKEIEIEI